MTLSLCEVYYVSATLKRSENISRILDIGAF